MTNNQWANFKLSNKNKLATYYFRSFVYFEKGNKI